MGEVLLVINNLTTKNKKWLLILFVAIISFLYSFYIVYDLIFITYIVIEVNNKTNAIIMTGRGNV